MKAALVESVDGKPGLAVREVPDPVAAAGELLVEVRAIGVNRADLLLRPDHFQAFPARERPPVPGIEAAGEVIALGAGVQGFAVGDRVAGLLPGAYAERAAMPAALAQRLPDGVDWETAASLPLALCTAHDALVQTGGLRAGQTVAVLGATSVVGVVAIQLAKRFGAARVVGTGRSAERLEALGALGLDAGLAHDPASVAAALRRETADRGVDLVVDLVGGELAAKALAGMAVGARWIQVGRLSGGATATIDLNELARLRAHLIGTTFRTRTLDECAALSRAAWASVEGTLVERPLHVPRDRVYPLDRAADAHAHLRAGSVAGKVLMRTA